jgi:hypothetical protein
VRVIPHLIGDVVIAEQLAADLLLGRDRVQVGSRVLLAHGAAAVGIDGAVVVGELSVLELDAALRDERRACRVRP